MISWLLSPSEAVAEGAEIGFDIALIISTAVVVIGLIGEYRKHGWWKRHEHLAEMLVLYGVVAEMLAESGTFWYALRLQAIEEAAISKATTDASNAITEAARLGVTYKNLDSV